ncbi:unnamed protein product [Mytilus coruscus]|uniref:Tyr recombinase domain-containing protein n=1 Tax=Mytilus coruscus TaxID=42192 RepID=A0A6J8E8A1_MYTCO|nr:unnamed protein product [Mytilus coruscus]
MSRRGFTVIAYLDDFFICERTKQRCAHGLRVLLGKLGFAISWSKVFDPCQKLVFLGVEIDSTSLELRLPLTKLEQLRAELADFKQRKHVSKKQLQSLSGKLNWASSVVHGGRVFLRRIIDGIMKLKHDWHKMRLCGDILHDIHWWYNFMSTFNGKSLLLNTNPVTSVYTDACKTGLQARREVANLDNLVDTFRSYTYAESTKKTYQTYLNSYRKFCALVNIPLVPLSKENLARYIAFLSQKLCFNSISNYISIIKLLHLEAGQPPPIDSHYIHTVLQGAKRVLSTMVQRKLPITPQLLKKILTTLDLQNPNHISFWAACLVAFFSFFRKSNLFVPTLAEFDAGKHLSRQDIVFQTSGTLLLHNLKSKTIQFANRLLEIPLPRILNSPLCPSQALLLHVKMIPAVSCPSPAFLHISKGTTVPLTYSTFLHMLKHSLSQLKLDTSGYSGHSFRRGGATFALECGVSSDLIQAQGDWKSEAYKGYLDPSFSHKQPVMNAFASALSQ